MLSAIVLLLAALQAVPPPPTRTPAPAAEAAPAGNLTQGYRIGAGDILRVTVYGHEDLTQTVVVQPGGTFVFPLIGPVSAGEATPAEVEARIVARLAKGLIREPRVTVTVQEYRSKVVYVVGEVTRPGTYPLGGDTSVVEMLSRAGPLSAQAGSEVVVVRPAAPIDHPVLPGEASVAAGVARSGAPSPTAAVLRVNLRALEAGHLDQNLPLQPNDTVFVPQAEHIFVTGQVRNPGAFAFSAGLTVRQAVSLAGGFTEDAATGSAKVVRSLKGESRSIKIKLDEVLLPGDTVLIKAKLF